MFPRPRRFLKACFQYFSKGKQLTNVQRRSGMCYLYLYLSLFVCKLTRLLTYEDVTRSVSKTLRERRRSTRRFIDMWKMNLKPGAREDNSSNWGKLFQEHTHGNISLRTYTHSYISTVFALSLDWLIEAIFLTLCPLYFVDMWFLQQWQQLWVQLMPCLAFSY